MRVHQVAHQPSQAVARPSRSHRSSAAVRAQAGAAAGGAAAPPRPRNAVLVALVEALFKCPPIFALAAKNARSMIVKRGEQMGLDFAAEIAALQGVDWDRELEAVRDPSVQFPSYYKVPFHAYPEGNLAMEPAMEMTVAARSVHSTIYGEGGELDPNGDDRLRSTYSECMQALMAELGARPVRDVLDVGAATGLSSQALLKAFPGAHVTGLDLSPHMLAVGSYMQRQRQAQRAAAGQPPEQLTLLHGLGEDTKLPAESFDLVSVMLVCHELPAAASAAVFKEAHRLLRPGGCLAVMEMNPASPSFQRIFSNPFPFAFKSTEPWLLEYLSLDMPAAMMAAGFAPPRQLGNSPRHKTVVAVKPAATP